MNEKIAAMPISEPVKFPLATGEGEVWELNGNKYRLFCQGQATDEAKATEVKSDDIRDCEKVFDSKGRAFPLLPVSFYTSYFVQNRRHLLCFSTGNQLT